MGKWPLMLREMRSFIFLENQLKQSVSYYPIFKNNEL